MSTIDSTSQAAAVGVGSKNEQFGIAGGNVVRKVGIVASYDPLKTLVIDEVPVQILNEADGGDRFGFGYPLHRLIKRYFESSEGSGEVWAVPQTETGTEADGEIAWSGTVSAIGTISLRIGGELYPIPITDAAATIEEVSDAVVAFVNAIVDTPVVAAKTAVTFETTFTSKAKGLEQDNISISLSNEQGEALPTGLVGAITPMANGAGTPDIDDALNGLGTGDEANQKNFTHLVHGYGLDTDTIDKVSAYVGEGNDFVGLYSKLIGRPFMCLSADTVAGPAGLTALRVISDARLSDRANGILGVPDSPQIPTELAALGTGYMARISQNNPAQNFTGQILSGVNGGDSADRWTKDYSSRDSAVKGGISPTIVKSEEVFLQNVITFYRPTSVPASSNGYKSMRSLAIIQDILFKIHETFEAEVWQGITIVADKSLVTDFEAKQKARDVLDVRTTVNNLADFFASKSWFFDAEFSKKNSEVTIRALSNGFDINFKWKMSGEAQIYNVQSSFDTNISG